MAEASSTSTLRTLMPSGGVWGVLSIMPRIWPAACSAAAGSSASLMPPALPRPPACTCALTTTLPLSRWAIARACAGVSATSPFGTATPNSRSSALAWYSWIFIREGSQDQGHRSELTADRIERKAERLEGQCAEQRGVAFLAEDHVAPADPLLILEDRRPPPANDRCAVREPKAFARERLDLESSQDAARYDRIRRARIDDGIEALSHLGLRGYHHIDPTPRDSPGMQASTLTMPR